MPQDPPPPGPAAAQTVTVAPLAQGRQSTLMAVLLLMVAVALFSGLDTVAKFLVTRLHIPVTEVVWLRFVGQSFYMVLVFGLTSRKQYCIHQF